MNKKITLIIILISSFGFAQDYNWSASAVSGNWNNASNWNEGLPVDNGIVYFNDNTQLTMTNDLVTTNLFGIFFNAGATSVRTIGGSTEYSIGAVGIRNQSSATHIINFPIKLGISTFIGNSNGVTGGFTFGGTIDTNGNNLQLVPDALATYTLNNVISGTGGVILTGFGTTYFKSANTYSSNTIIINGTLILQADLANSAIQLQNSSTLTIDGADIHIASLNGNSGSSTVSLTSGSALTTGTFFNPGALTLNANTSLTVNGDLSQVSAAVTLNANTTLTVNGNFTVNHALEIPSGATVNVTGNLSNGVGVITIQPGGKLTVGGTWNRTNFVDIIVNSDATGSGSLIFSGSSATAEMTFNQYLTGGSQWHLIGAPTIGNPATAQAITDFITSFGATMTQSGVNYSLAAYDNTGVIDVSTWKHYTTDGSNPAPATAFVQGKGYEILMNNTQTVAFNGTIPKSQVDIGITEGLSRWNLIANPFPSSIFANVGADATNNFLTVNSAALDPSFIAMYVWNPSNGSYDLINQASGARTLAPGQGFFVNSKTGGATVNFTTAMRTHQTANAFQKIKTNEIPSIVLSVDNNIGTIKTTEIKYMGGTTLGLDRGYDAGVFGGATSNFGVFTHLVADNGVDFALQVVPDNNYDTTIIPIGLDADAGTQVTFKANVTDLPLGKKVFLEDKLLNTVTELNYSDKTYSVTLSSASSGIGRFYIHTQDNLSTLGLEDIVKSKFTLVASPNTNSIKVFGFIEQSGSLDIYDSLGRKVFNTTLKAGSTNEVQVPSMATGVYFVKLKTNTSNYNQKIVWY